MHLVSYKRDEALPSKQDRLVQSYANVRDVRSHKHVHITVRDVHKKVSEHLVNRTCGEMTEGINMVTRFMETDRSRAFRSLSNSSIDPTLRVTTPSQQVK